MIKTMLHSNKQVHDGTRDKEINLFNMDYEVFATQTNTLKDNNMEILVTTLFYKSKSK